MLTYIKMYYGKEDNVSNNKVCIKVQHWNLKQLSTLKPDLLKLNIKNVIWKISGHDSI